MTIDLKTMDKYKTIDFKMLIMYLETIYFAFIAKYASIHKYIKGIKEVFVPLNRPASFIA
jgi:hypothetical protein